MTSSPEDQNKVTILDRLGGDRVVWLIVLLLMMVSLIGIASATSSMATGERDRLDIIWRQLLTVGLGLLTIILLYLVPIKWLKKVSSLGFAFTAISLIFLDAHINLGFIKAAPINGAWRIIKVGGLQIHILEAVKVTMVMYLAWAVDRYKNGEFRLQIALSRLPHMRWLGTDGSLKIVNIYLPMLLAIVLALPAGNSNAVFLTGIMFLTILLAGMPFKDLAKAIGLIVAILGLCVGLYFTTRSAPEGHFRFFQRMDTLFSKSRDLDANIETLEQARAGTIEYQEALDLIRQPYGAKMAIRRGGLIGRGPGKSTMKYVVPVIYEDYIFSFLLEEYGLIFGGVLIIVLYLGLLARGAIIARNCEDLYAKVTVGGLSALITGQAMMHILVNCDMGIQTGQTLPLISYGMSAFLCFSAAFGVILSISRKTQDKVEEEAESSNAIMVATGEEIVTTPDNIIKL